MCVLCCVCVRTRTHTFYARGYVLHVWICVHGLFRVGVRTGCGCRALSVWGVPLRQRTQRDAQHRRPESLPSRLVCLQRWASGVLALALLGWLEGSVS